MLALSQRALGCFELFPSAVSSGCEARLRGRGLRGRGAEGQKPWVVCCLDVLGGLGGWASLVIQGLPRLEAACPTSTP